MNKETSPMKVACFGEIMLRLSTPDGLRLSQSRQLDMDFGGSEANVAVSLAQWGIDTAYVTRLPDNELGKTALSALTAFGVQTGHCITGGERLGTYYIEYGAGLRSSKITYDRSYSGMATLKPGMINWPEVLKDARWLHWSGITPALSQQTAEAMLEALQLASDLGLTISCDLNYRDKLWKYGKQPADIMPSLVELTHVLLGDSNAFNLYFNIKENTDEILLAEVKKRFPALKYVSMTSRNSPSASHNTYRGMLFDGLEYYYSKEYNLLDMLDRIGAGDALMAGLIYGLTKENPDLKDTINFAVAAAALKHYIRGDFNLSSESEVRALMQGNTGGRVER